MISDFQSRGQPMHFQCIVVESVIFLSFVQLWTKTWKQKPRMDTNWMICLVIAAILAVLTDGLNSSRVAFATKPSFRVRLWNLIVQGWQTNEMAKMPKTNGMIERFNYFSTLVQTYAL